MCKFIEMSELIVVTLWEYMYCHCLADWKHVVAFLVLIPRNTK